MAYLIKKTKKVPIFKNEMQVQLMYYIIITNSIQKTKQYKFCYKYKIAIN